MILNSSIEVEFIQSIQISKKGNLRELVGKGILNPGGSPV